MDVNRRRNFGRRSTPKQGSCSVPISQDVSLFCGTLCAETRLAPSIAACRHGRVAGRTLAAGSTFLAAIAPRARKVERPFERTFDRHMRLLLNWGAALKHPLSSEGRRKFRRQAVRELEETRLMLSTSSQSVERYEARHDQLEATLSMLRAENAALKAENAALAQYSAAEPDLKSALSPVALGDVVAAQIADARDRLASRLEILTFEVVDVRRRIGAAGRQNASDETGRLYLDLLESALTGMLTRDGHAAPWGTEEFDADRRLYGRDWPKTALTMIGTARMRNLRRLVETVLGEGVEGDFLEAGVWRGGACIYMRGILAAQGVRHRKVWVADSFAGLPEADETLYPADKGDPHHTFNELSISLDQVKESFSRFGLLDAQVVFLRGWFKDTLVKAPVERLAVLRLDGDMYGSTMETLQALYDRVTPGGFIIVDDYLLPACREAIDDFRRARSIDEPLQDVDGAAAYWRRA
jgi:O-methyltransferase